MSGVFEHFAAAWRELLAPGAGFEMDTIEVRGIPMRVFRRAPATMRAVWEGAAGHGDRTYLVYEDERFTYAEVAAEVRALAHHLRQHHGVGPGDRVAVAMRNYPEWVVSYWATVSLGAALVGLNAWWTPAELAYGLRDSAPKVLIADEERLARAVEAGTDLALIAVRAGGPLPDRAVRWGDVVDPQGAPAELPPAEIDPDDDAAIFYTSGTTGAPKGAQLTHRGSVQNLFDLVFVNLASAVAEAKAIAAGDLPEPPPTRHGRADSPPVFMAPTPLFHVTATNCVLHPATLAGAPVVLMYKWDPGRALELIERERVTNFSGVPTMSREMLNHPDFARRDTASVRSMGGGGAAVQPDLVAKIDRALGGGRPSTGYGLTETTGVITANMAALYLAKPTSCGRVVPALDAKLVDPAGSDLPSGTDAIGELCVRGSVVVKGYLNQPEATAAAIVDGWFHTGDIARIDADGFVHLVDRVKDIVLRGGENVYCAEVENSIYAHPAIAEAAVFGLPDDRLGERVAAAVVLLPGATLGEPELRDFLAERIAAYKVPDTIWFRSAPLPVNANGKILKRELRQALLDRA